ncbi:MAG: DEAD/DEAH box helicase [Bacilli bacterium]
MKFNELPIKEEILKAIEENGYVNPTEIQEKIIPLIFDGIDVLGQSQTGTGKTLAFAAAILSKVKNNKKVQALILAPTRELAIQIDREISGLGKYLKIKSTCVYGSSSIQSQIREIRSGVEIVVGTPGRVKDLINRKVLCVDKLDFFVLDEADEMLSMGFQEELEYIFEGTNKEKHVLLFSATMPKQILTIAQKYMKPDYKMISVISEIKTADNILQNYYIVDDKSRLESLCRIIDFYNPNKAIIFCRTKRLADEVLEKLLSRKYSANVIHGDITQDQRIATLDKFKTGKFNYLIATDVAARGIHVDDVELVINYNVPESNEAYVHRIGRTGRVNKSGVAITFIKPRELYVINSIENHIHTKINKEQIPTADQILPSKVEALLKKIDNVKNKTSINFNEYLEKLTADEVKNIASSLLEKELKKSLGSDFNVNLNVKATKEKRNRNSDDCVRVFMTIGKMDNVEKREFLSFIEKTAEVPEGTCSNVEIMTKFTFMNIKKDKFDIIFKKCNNIKYNSRIIRIEKAKK